MREKLPSPVLLSVILAGILTLLFLLVQVVGGRIDTLWFEGILFFLLGSLLIGLTLEFGLFRRLKNQRSQNQREIKKLKEMEAYRREFLGEVSHELKTPIFAVQGFIHTLIDGAMEDDRVRKKFLKKAMKNADRLSNLVDDLMIITQAESGEMDLKIRAFSIHELIQDVLDTLEYKFTKKQRNISCNLVTNGQEQAAVLADRERIEQVMTNLLDNAIKYGDAEGNIEIELNSQNNKIMISITDDGPGIEEEHLDKIFRRFYRVDKSRSREKGGTGLGLAICKHLLKMHGEPIMVSSTLNKGTTFTFSLKLAS